jgi:hypothetical protein
MEGVFNLFELPVGETVKNGVATLASYKISGEQAMMENLRLVRDGGWLFRVTEGEYIKLIVNNQLMMSDTPMEKNSNQEFVRNANGHVFIAGLGIGLILNALRDKVKSGIVNKITVIEKYQDVIDLISHKFSDMPIEYICDDVLNYKPNKDQKYDTIYFDIWPTISTDNLPEISKLHNRFKNHKNKNNPSCWMGSWMQKYLQNKKREEARYSYYW